MPKQFPAKPQAKAYTPPQPFSDKPRPAIALTIVDSSQIHSVGYDETTRTLALRFLAPGDRDLPVAERVGGNAIYHYPNVMPEIHAEMLAAESIGTYFGKHVKKLTFDKFHAETAEA